MTKPTPKPKKPSRERPATYNEGGDTPMHGKGDRTRTSTADAAGLQRPGRTDQTSKENPRFPEGGRRQQATEAGEGKVQHVRVAGGLAFRAMPGACGTGTETIPEGEQHWRRGKRI
jgi:hypothetical protein